MLNYKSNFYINYIELKYKIIYMLVAFWVLVVIFYIYKVELFFNISKFLLDWKTDFIYNSVIDPMFIYIKLVFLYSFLFVIPISAYFMIFYFLRSYPTVYVYFTFIFFLVFFFFSLFVYYFIVHFLAKFLLQFILSYQRIQIIFVLQIYLEATISSYYNFFFNFIVFYLLVMILPFFLMCIIFFNVKDLRFLYKRQMRKKLYIFFGIVFLLLAPPDFWVQIIIFPFLCSIIEIYFYYSILLSRAYRSLRKRSS